MICSTNWVRYWIDEILGCQIIPYNIIKKLVQHYLIQGNLML